MLALNDGCLSVLMSPQIDTSVGTGRKRLQFYAEALPEKISSKKLEIGRRQSVKVVLRH